MQIQLDTIEKKLRWPTLVAEARELQNNLESLSVDLGISDLQDKAEDWSVSLDSIILKKQTERLHRKIEEGRSICEKFQFAIKKKSLRPDLLVEDADGNLFIRRYGNEPRIR